MRAPRYGRYASHSGTLTKERARALRLDAAVLSLALRSGHFRSLRAGVHGVDFAGVREYTPFDDARFIDWNASARSNRTYVKLFEEDRDCQIFILLDASLSMLTGTSRTRWEAAAEAAQLIALAADMGGIRVGGAIFSGEVHTLVPPDAKGTFLQHLFKAQAAAIDGKSGTCMDKALMAALSTLKMRSFVVILSDFRCVTSLYDSPLAALAKCHDAAAFCVTDPTDKALPRLGTVRARDAETGESALLPTSSAYFATKWEARGAQRLAAWRDTCARRGAVSAVLPTGEDVLGGLMRVFGGGGRRG